MNLQTNLWHPKRKTGPPLGFKNLGNSCYLNSVLQCLTYTPLFSNLCLKSHHSSLCDSSGVERKRDCPFCILERRITRSLTLDLTTDAPYKIQKCLRIFAEHFRYGKQEDAHEFLRYVIDACHNVCLRLKKLRLKGNEPFNGGSTVVKEIFGGALLSQVKCLSCGAESNKVDDIMDISLDVLHSSSVDQAMVKFFQPEILDGNNKYKCENCKKLAAARKQMFIQEAPNVLVIQLKRLEGIFGGKIDKTIDFEEVLVLSNFMCKTSQDLHPEYKLFGSIVHSGLSPDSGHYYAYIKDAMGRWYCCNDSYVTLSTLQEVLSEKVYILFFSRVKQKTGTTTTALASNGAKAHNYSCNNATISPKKANNSPKIPLGQKTVHTKQNADHFSGKNTSTLPKNGRVSSSLQMTFNNGNYGSKRVPATENVNLDIRTSQSNGKDMENKENNMEPAIKMNGKKGVPSLVNGIGVLKSKNVDNVNGNLGQAITLPSDNGKVLSSSADSEKAEISEINNGKRSEVTTGSELGSHKMYNEDVNGHTDNLSSKRKSHDLHPCILLAKDARSQAQIKEFKEVLMKDASLALWSSGWSDEVYSFMHLQKKLCARDAGNNSLSNEKESKKKLIALAKPSFIPQIPKSLKESLIERLKLFNEKKPILDP